ncbi:hypothetical protein DXG01_002229 [Tephrocybe rancida]|nr:hypothetical protein DXG01_002229 [Tephrocybe rancida]
MFTKARYTTINGGTFTQHTHLPASRSSSEPALFQLLQHSAPGAVYDLQAHPPCHPGTTALRTVSNWMFSPRSSRKPVLWLHGPSQALNSSIAQHIADKCTQRGELAGSFFFDSTRPKRSNITHFAPTLALQLALSPLHGFQPGLVKALQETPFVAHGAIPTQVEQLLLQPLRGASVPGPFLVIIDALDQCEGEENQREVLAQLARIVRAPRNPLRFIVTSADAPHLRRAFDEPELRAVSSSAGVATNPTIFAEALSMSSWMGDRKPTGILWLHGPSPALSSSIAQCVVQRHTLRGKLAASFFFVSACPKYASITHAVPTLALQLAFSLLRGFRPRLTKALHEDPFINYRSFPTQVERLLLDPLRGVSATPPFLVVIDALDQCGGGENQREVVAQLVRIVRAPWSPLRIIVTSADMSHLRHAFDEPELKAIRIQQQCCCCDKWAPYDNTCRGA